MPLLDVVADGGVGVIFAAATGFTQSLLTLVRGQVTTSPGEQSMPLLRGKFCKVMGAAVQD